MKTPFIRFHRTPPDDGVISSPKGGLIDEYRDDSAGLIEGIIQEVDAVYISLVASRH